MNLNFQYTYLLWLLALLPVVLFIYFIARYKKQKQFAKIGDAYLVNKLTEHYNKNSFVRKFLLTFFSLALILLSIANLRSNIGMQKVNRNGIDIMIAIDVSKSMLAQDVPPNRLEKAKQLLNKLIDKLSNDRVGIVVFAGKAYLQMPLTADHSAAKMYLAAATPETVPTQGTVIGDALKTCFASFNSKENKYKAVVLISDGEDHDENAIAIAEKMAQTGVIINTVGIGSPQGAPIMDATTNELKKDEQGNTVVTKLNELALTEIAKKGNGNYIFYNNTDAVVSTLYSKLSTLEGRAVVDDSLVNYKSWFQILLCIALALLIIELFINEVKKSKSKKIPALSILLFLLLMQSNSFAQKENSVIQKGNEAYKKNDFPNALNNYNQVIKNDQNNAVANFNLGNALYKTNKPEEALAAYDKAEQNMKKPLEKSDVNYNKGVVLQNNKKLEECITTYKNALKINPNNVSARHNLQIALQQQKKEQDEQDNNDSKDKKQDQKNDGDKNNQQPKPKPSNISKQDAAQKLEALLQKEKELQDKFHKVSASTPEKPEKDW